MHGYSLQLETLSDTLLLLEALSLNVYSWILSYMQGVELYHLTLRVSLKPEAVRELLQELGLGKNLKDIPL